MDTGEIIRSWRHARDLTQAELAQRIGVDQSYVSRYESGRRAPGIAVLERFASGLGGQVHVTLRPTLRTETGWAPLTLASLGAELMEGNCSP